MVEQIHLRRRPDQMQIDCSLHLRRKVRQPCALRIDAGKRGDTQSASPSPEELTARFGSYGFVFRMEHHLFSTSSRFSTWFASIVIAASSVGSTLVSDSYS